MLAMVNARETGKEGFAFMDLQIQQKQTYDEKNEHSQITVEAQKR